MGLVVRGTHHKERAETFSPTPQNPGKGKGLVVIQLSPILCDSMACSTPGSSVLHYLWRLLKFMSTESGTLFNHLFLCHPLLLLSSIFPSIRVFSSESALWIRWSNHWSFNFSISLSNDIHDCFPLRLTGLISLQSKGLSRVFSSTTVQMHQFFGAQPSLWSNCHICTWLLERARDWINHQNPMS